MAQRRIQLVQPSPSLGHEISSDATPTWLLILIGAAFALPEKIMAAVSGEGSPRLSAMAESRVQIFDSDER
jgi:hypothetical protein